MRPLLLALVAALVPTAAHAAKPTAEGLVSVFRPTVDGELPAADLETFWDLIQGAASEELTPQGFTVLTGETSVKLLADNGISQDQIERTCSKGGCPLEMARELKVKLFVTSIVRKLADGSLSAFVRLYSGESGQLLASTKELEGRTFKQVRDAFGNDSERFFAKALKALGIKPLSEAAKKAAEAVMRQQREAEEAAERAAAEEARVKKAEQDRLDAEAAETRAREERERAEQAALEERERNRPPEPPGPHFAVRGGVGGHTGVLGAGIEARVSHFALALGYGSYLSGGVSLLWRRDGSGGPYLDVHFAQSLVRTHDSSGVGATVGWDWRPLGPLSIKTGIGIAVPSGVEDTGATRFWMADAAAGVVF